MSSVKIEATLRALRTSMDGIRFGQVLFITSQPLAASGITIARIPTLDYNGYSRFIAYQLKDYVATDHVLLVQHDGYVLYPRHWDPRFLDYDYVGAPWPPGTFLAKFGTDIRVGNGGFSLRSNRLLRAVHDLALPFTDGGSGYFNEDGLICLHHRQALEAAGIRFAPVDIAARFSYELECPESVARPFGFHGTRLLLPRSLWPVEKYLRALKARVAR